MRLFQCQGCKTPLTLPTPTCSQCLSMVTYWRQVSLCQTCLLHPASEPCPRPWWKVDSIKTRYAAYLAFGPVHELIKRWKTTGGRALDQLLVHRWLDEHNPVLAKEWQVDGIVPIPQILKRRLQLGGGSSERLATLLSNRLHVPMARFALTQAQSNRETHQAQTEASERSKDMGFVWQPQRSIELKRILLVDDLQTTGQTLGQAARAIKKSSPDMEIKTFVLGVRPPAGSHSSQMADSALWVDRGQRFVTRDVA